MARDRIENEKLVRINRSLHAAWRDAVRTPLRNFRRRLRDALPVSSEGVRVALDETTTLAAVPYRGTLAARRSRNARSSRPRNTGPGLHPLSVNSTNAERVHYLDHTVHAPAMTLEHLVDQYWFPAFGLLISPEGRVWRHSFLVPYREGYLSSIKAIVERTAAGRNARAPAASRAACARASNRRRASADRRLGQAQLRPLSARHRAADRSRRENAARRC